MQRGVLCVLFFFFNDTATTEIYTLSLHDALPISGGTHPGSNSVAIHLADGWRGIRIGAIGIVVPRAHESLRGHHRSEEHTSELQSRLHLVCRLLLEKKNSYQSRWADSLR